MKHVLTIAIIILGTSLSRSQEIKQTAKEKMKTLSLFEGTWKGKATNFSPTSSATSSQVTEKVEWKLDSLALLFQSIGTRSDSTEQYKKPFETLGILSYDERLKIFKHQGHLSDGKTGDLILQQIKENEFVLTLDIPNGKIKHTITFSEKGTKWSEIGSYSPDGKKWHKFLELYLVKQS